MSGFFGAGVLVLGSLVCADFALPERVSYGGAQQITVHRLPGGQRVFDLTGSDPAAIHFSGIFLGLDAQSNRMQLEAIRDAGEPVDLSWGEQAYSVLVADVQLEDRFQRVDFRVTCIVVPDIADDEYEDEADYGDGEMPDTPSAATDTGQAVATKARKSVSVMPVPPMLPSSVGAGQG